MVIRVRRNRVACRGPGARRALRADVVAPGRNGAAGTRGVLRVQGRRAAGPHSWVARAAPHDTAGARRIPTRGKQPRSHTLAGMDVTTTSSRPSARRLADADGRRRLLGRLVGPSRTLTPVLEQAVESRNGEVVLAKVDVDASPSWPSSYGVGGPRRQGVSARRRRGRVRRREAAAGGRRLPGRAGRAVRGEPAAGQAAGARRPARRRGRRGGGRLGGGFRGCCWPSSRPPTTPMPGTSFGS